MKMILKLFVSELMAACWLKQSVSSKKGYSAFTPCFQVKYFWKVSLHSVCKFTGLLVQLHKHYYHWYKGGVGKDIDRLSSDRRVGLSPWPAETYCASQLWNYPQVLSLERLGKRVRLFLLLSLPTRELQPYCSTYYSQLFTLLFQQPGSSCS